MTNDLAAVLVVSQVDQWLIVNDVFAPSVFDLIHALASAIDAPVEGIEFCFDPGEWLSAMTMKVESYTSAVARLNCVRQPILGAQLP